MFEIAPHHRHITVRVATDADRLALDRLAAVDSADRAPDRALVAEVDGTPVAAVSIDGRDAIADPFERTAEIVEMLRLRVRQLSPRPARRGRALRPAAAW